VAGDFEEERGLRSNRWGRRSGSGTGPQASLRIAERTGDETRHGHRRGPRMG